MRASIPLRDTIQSRTFPLVTVSLIVINALVFIYEISLAGPALGSFITAYGVIPLRFLEQPGGRTAELTTLFTSMFLHGGWLHLLGNMLYLWIFGDNVEDRLGHGLFLFFYLLGGVAAGMTHILFNTGSQIPTVGASGAIAGVLGAYLLFFPRSRVVSLVFIGFFITTVEIPASFFLGFWFLFQFLSGAAFVASGTQAAGIAWWAHIGGFVAGLLLAYLLKPERDGSAKRFS